LHKNKKVNIFTGSQQCFKQVCVGTFVTKAAKIGSHFRPILSLHHQAPHISLNSK